MLPSPGDEGPFKYWFSRATIPAKIGDDAEVPPMMEG
jgi:hypothetical protein